MASDARVLGKAYVKQVDVVMSDWATGPELLVSTKRMDSSFSNNAANRIEESYGDAKNLRARHPLAVQGYVLVLRSTILSESPATFDRIADLLVKLESEVDAYDAVGLVMVAWDDDDPSSLDVVDRAVPPELAIDRFVDRIVRFVLERTPIDHHAEARRRSTRAGPTKFQ